jgi:putative FmdB family regulatory protein
MRSSSQNSRPSVGPPIDPEDPMPLYEYQCQECALRFERIEKASPRRDGICAECGGAAHRLIGTPALQFKGSGWYVNDYGKGNGNGSSPTPNETETAKAAAESSTDSTPKKKPEKKADAKVA